MDGKANRRLAHIRTIGASRSRPDWAKSHIRQYDHFYRIIRADGPLVSDDDAGRYESTNVSVPSGVCFRATLQPWKDGKAEKAGQSMNIFPRRGDIVSGGAKLAA
jgi:hypothetical protein